MSDDLQNRLDRPYAQQPATLAAAARYLTRTDNADLLPMLGLADPEPEPADGDPRITYPQPSSTERNELSTGCPETHP